MPTPTPEQGGGTARSDGPLDEALESLVTFTGATAGWVGLIDGAGRLSFPARRGSFPAEWLDLQQAQGQVWGFAVREGPTLLNDLRGLAPLGVPDLHNLLSSPLGPADQPRGHVVLANKPHGFTSHDASVLQGIAHFMYRRVSSGTACDPALAPLLRRVLDKVDTGIVIVDEAGTLLHANGAWLDWIGFTLPEVVGRPAPFPFWVSHRELAAAGGQVGARPAGALPFRRRDQSLFWCRVDTIVETVGDRRLTAALLQQALVAGKPAAEAVRPALLPLLAEDLPFSVTLTDGAGRLLWGNAATARLLPRESPDGLLSGRFEGQAATALERLHRELARSEPGRLGSLVLQHAGKPVTAFWLAVSLTDGPGCLLALTTAAEGFTATVGPDVGRPAAGPPAVDWLGLLLQPGAEVVFWDERWERITGLSSADLVGVRGEVVLDWLFPRQRDRNLVADWLHDPRRRGGQAVLEVLARSGSRPLLCTFLPVVQAEGTGRKDHWLLLAGESELVTAHSAASREGAGRPLRCATSASYR